MPSPPTVRTLASELGLSRTTVSDALRGVGRIDPATAARVHQAAQRAGYQRNPLAAAVMSELRRSRGSSFRGVLAIADVYEPQRLPHGIFHRELVRGIDARATSLGFKTEEFVVGRDGMTVSRLDTILQSRGIHGLLFLPTWYPPDWAQLNWSRFAGVYTDYNVGRPAMHCVCCDHFRSMMATLGRLAARGYRRPGLFIEHGRDQRIDHRLGAAFRVFQEKHTHIERIPLAAVPRFRREEFEPWFERYRPDVVLSHFTEALDWMEASGARVPADHGFVSLNLVYRQRPCAGIDLQPKVLGARSAEQLIAQLQRTELGLPDFPTTSTLMARWVEGPTISPEKK